MKIISWNVNGLRACIKKGFWEFFSEVDADIFCVQEIKMDPGQVELDTQGYSVYWYAAEKKGYAGTAIFSKCPANDIMYGLSSGVGMKDGRVITLEFNDFYIINCYAPHSQRNLKHLKYKEQFNCAFIDHVERLKNRKAVIICGDLNVAHKEIDLANPRANMRNAGYTLQERNAFTRLLNLGFIDSYRYLNPKKTGAYTWWSYRKGFRERNIGWRIDYILVSEQAESQLLHATIYSSVYGSDHCPVGADLKLSY